MKYPKPKRKEKKSTLKKKADVLMSKFIRKIGHCEHCGATDKALQAAHIVTRSNLRLRYDVQNIICLCNGCHIYWWHKEPLEAVEWFNSAYPGRMKYLLKVKNEKKQMTLDDYKEVINYLSNYV